MIIGRIKQIWRYPVKSMSGQQLDECTVGMLGLPGDRGWALRDEKTKEITNGKRIPLLMQCAARYREEPENGNIPHVAIACHDGTTIGSDQADVNERLSQALGRALSLATAGANQQSALSPRIGSQPPESLQDERDQLPRLLCSSVDAELRRRSVCQTNRP
jgi:uncharacterized protein YcbX